MFFVAFFFFTFLSCKWLLSCGVDTHTHTHTHTLGVSVSPRSCTLSLSQEFRYNNTFPKLTFNPSKQITVEIPHPSMSGNVFMAARAHTGKTQSCIHLVRARRHGDITEHLSRSPSRLSGEYAYLWFYWRKRCPPFPLLALSLSPLGLLR